VLFVPILSCKAAVITASDGLTTAVNRQPFSQSMGPISDGSIPISNPGYPIVTAFPALSETLKMVPLCHCPTPIQRLSNLEMAITEASPNLQIYVKQDGASNPLIYGGNKIRKLELLMAQALYSGKKEIIITGSVGSNSVVATALVAKHLGLVPTIHLIPQAPSPRVTTNLLVLSRILALPLGDWATPSLGSETIGTITYHSSASRAFGAVAGHAIRSAFSKQEVPFLCPPGATTPLTTIAYVNAMYELAADVEAGRLPAPPSRIYVPAGSGGTFIGLLIGAKSIPMFHRTEIIPVTSGSNRPTAQYWNHFKQVNAYLRELSGGAFPTITLHKQELETMLDRAFAGDHYAAITEWGVEAKSLAIRDGLEVEYTYTANTLARLIHDAREGSPTSEVWLY